jgi:hypothetical protein
MSEEPGGNRLNKSTASAARSLVADERNRRAKHGIAAPAISEVLRDGRQAVLADHITDGPESIRGWEGGEPRSKGPTQGKERPGITEFGGNYGRDSGLTNHITETPEECVTGTASVMRQTGSVTCLVRHGLRPLTTEEPDALIGHVRVCGGSGGQPLLLPGSPALRYAGLTRALAGNLC